MSEPEFKNTEDLNVKQRHDVYPGTDPKPVYASKAYRGKVVLISGASRGIGEEISLTYARAGATLSLLARSTEALASVKDSIVKVVPDARVEVFKVDVTKPLEVRAAVEGTIEKFGKIDIVIANAGKAERWNKHFTEQDPLDWWRTFEVNVRGVFNLAHFAVPHLKATKGYFVAVSSMAAQIRWPYMSAYGTSKHALGRFVEFIGLEQPDLKVFALHPGSIKTDMADETGVFPEVLIDSLQLPATTLLRLTSGSMDWLSSRYVSSTWDLDDLEKNWKTKILSENALVSKLSLPSA
ncbi:NAD-P-binding protein [Schizopora paradoxa]|uniref:NAD-P-binding protein n=1 Tax=Schizopora paradoxa TaxID=27342 RepID=A0A0H2R5B2_9AGAM|nr:NAD-P-binding protein [Schizopora paradoxa]